MTTGMGRRAERGPDRIGWFHGANVDDADSGISLSRHARVVHARAEYIDRIFVPRPKA